MHYYAYRLQKSFIAYLLAALAEEQPLAFDTVTFSTVNTFSYRHEELEIAEYDYIRLAGHLCSVLRCKDFK